MKKTLSLIKASMTSDMSVFKFKSSKKNNNKILILFIAVMLMFSLYSTYAEIFAKFAPLNLQTLLLAALVLSISVLTIFEGIYKTSSLLFNCKDDQLLYSLPIKKSTILFLRMFKFYVFEVLFNSIFFIPVIIAYIEYTPSITWTFYLTSVVMILTIPIIPVVISTILGFFTTNLSSKVKYKNAMQIITSIVLILGIMYASFKMDNVYNYMIEHSDSMNDFITKLCYPAGMYATLATKFSLLKLIEYIIVNIVILTVGIFILSKFYFKINSSYKEVTTVQNKKIKKGELKFVQNNPVRSLIKKEITTFFKTPVFIINAGFALVFFFIIAVAICFKFDSLYESLFASTGEVTITKEAILSHMSLAIFMLVAFASFMTSITNSVISLEGKNISILKSLPLEPKRILMSKVHAALVITTPPMLIGTLIMLINFKINIIESILILLLTILMPLVSHFIGIIINLKFPKLNYDNSAEVVKQSVSSFLAVMIGMILLIANGYVVFEGFDEYNPTIFLGIATIVYIVINIVLYIVLSTMSVKDFRKLSI